MVKVKTPLYINSDEVVLKKEPASWIPVDGTVYIISMSELTKEQMNELMSTVEQLLIHIQI